MKAIVLAAGYATRLYPLTKNKAKPLLEVGGRPMVEHLLGQLERIEELDHIYLVTNDRFAADFEAWRQTYDGTRPITIVNDGTRTNEDRLGAIGDIYFVIRQCQLDDDLLIAAGDNLVGFDLREYVAFFHAHGTSIGVLFEPDPAKVGRYSTVRLDENHRVISFVEKPPDPQPSFVGITVYLIARADVHYYADYLAQGGNPDAPGYFIQWLHSRTRVSGFEVRGTWFDIGDHAELRKADEEVRRRWQGGRIEV